MFFDRSTSDLGSAQPTSNVPSILARRKAVLGLAIAAALPLAGASRLYADPTIPVMAADEPNKSDSDLLKQGVQQYNDGQYEEAQTSLQQVNGGALSDADKATLKDYSAKAESSASERKNARALFEKGQDALTRQQGAEAATDFQGVIDNKFADAGTKAKAGEQLAVAQALRGDDGRKAYQLGRDEYRKGDWIAARLHLNAAETAGYKGGFMEESPASILAKMDKKEQADAAAAAKAEAQNTAVAVAPTTAPSDNSAVSTAAPAPQAAPTPAPTAAPVAAVPTTAPAVAAETPAAAPVADSLSTVSPKVAYVLGKKQYNEGDYDAARKNFEIAKAGNYKPGLFEGSTPDKYLTWIDQKQLAAKRDSLAQVAAQTTSAPTAAETPTPTTTTGPSQAERLQEAAQSDAVLAQQQAYRAGLLVDQARDAEKAGQNDVALQDYTQAHTLDPNNQAALQGMSRIQQAMGIAPAAGSSLDKTRNAIEERRSAIKYQFDEAIKRARAATNAKDFNAARAALETARVARDSDPTIWTPAETSEFTAVIASAQADLDKEVAENENKTQTQRTIDEQNAIDKEKHDEEERRHHTIADLITQSQELIRETRYQEALDKIDQILQLDPANDYALGVRPLVYDRYILQEQAGFRQKFNEETEKQLNAAEEAKIPYEDIMRYPLNWPDISAVREAEVKQERGESSGDAAVRAQLDRRLPEVNFNNNPFVDVVDFLRDVTGANIFVNWRALDAAQIDKNTQVTVRLKDVKFDKALRTILDEVGGPDKKLAYTIDDGVITISTADDLSKDVVTRVYDIRDLILSVPDFTDAPDFNLSSQASSGGSSTTGGGGGGGGGGGQSLFGGSGGGGGTTEKGQSRQDLVDAIIKLIEETVATDSWKDQGGQVGTLRELSGQLIVTQTPENQRALVSLLEQLRETRAIQVTIETRFLVVQRNFLEDVGLDTSFNFNVNNPNHFSQIPVTDTSSAFTQAPTTSVPGTIGDTAQSLLVSGTYLDNFQVNFLLRATQAAQYTTTLTAPRVTLFNGQRAYVLVAVQQAYVSNLTPVVGNSAVAFQPTISTVESGVLLDVQATVSSDRKYVTLTLRPQLATLLNLFSFAFESGASNGTTTENAGSGGIVVGAGGDAGTGVIQQPEIQITEVRTTVSVPDGGTLLLGGQTLAGEVEKEAGVPILSKIPFLKRLFTNKSTAKDEQVLLILCKPTILIERETEQKQFPLLSSKINTQE